MPTSPRRIWEMPSYTERADVGIGPYNVIPNQ